MYLSKSKYCNGYQCKKILWLDKYKQEVKEEVSNESVLDNGTEVGELARGLLGPYINIEFNESLNEMIKDTRKVLEEHSSCNITEASFDYNGNFCSVDILKKENNKYSIYEVKSSTEVKDIYLEDASYQYYVLTSLGYDVEKVYIVHINNKYVRKGNLDIKKLFKIEDITSTAKEKRQEVEKTIKDINKYMESKEEPQEKIGMQCSTPYDCPFFAYCTKDLEKPNVFDIRNMKMASKLKLYNNNMISFKELLKDGTIGWKYLEQIDYELNDKEPKIEIDKINEFLDTLTYPLYFLDFETFQQAIPKYDDISPYEQIPFQYSLHYLLNETDQLQHKEFLAQAGIDPRRSLAEQLVKDIPEDVCTLAYNMRFEKMVIYKLASLYPDLRDHLMNIHKNMKDLMVPFRDRNFYTKEMQGSYSIKYVLPALFPNDPSLNYHNLEEVHNGSEAMNAYANMGNLTKEEQESLRNNLLKYCGLDTYAMVKIYEKLEEVTNNKVLIKK